MDRKSPRRAWPGLVLGACGLLAGLQTGAAAREDDGPIAPSVRLVDQAARDQDDMGFWVHPTNPSRSTIIASDKSAGKIFVYDLSGHTLQTIDIPEPGNVDVRYNFPLGDHRIDIVAVNQRGQGPKIVVFRVDLATRRLDRVDDGSISTGVSAGGTLYRSPKTGKFYFLVTSYNGGVEQFELRGTPSGRIAGSKVRAWRLGATEAAVGDDEAGRIFVSEEKSGVWELGGEPDDPTPGELVIKVGEHGLAADVEGLTLYKLSAGHGYVIVSNQGRSRFHLYDRRKPHRFTASFSVEGARKTDGIDVVNLNLGGPFAKGAFACHTDVRAGNTRPILVTPFEQIARTVGVTTDSFWNPRTGP